MDVKSSVIDYLSLFCFVCYHLFLGFVQVERLSGRLQSKVDNGKGDTLDLAKKINQLQNKIKDVTRKVRHCMRTTVV